jgi:hypothetical protein
MDSDTNLINIFADRGAVSQSMPSMAILMVALLLLKLSHVLCEGLFMGLHLLASFSSVAGQRKAYHSRVPPVFQDADVAKTQFDEAFVDKIHWRLDVKRNWRLFHIT